MPYQSVFSGETPASQPNNQSGRSTPTTYVSVFTGEARREQPAPTAQPQPQNSDNFLSKLGNFFSNAGGAVVHFFQPTTPAPQSPLQLGGYGQTTQNQSNLSGDYSIKPGQIKLDDQQIKELGVMLKPQDVLQKSRDQGVTISADNGQSRPYRDDSVLGKIGQFWDNIFNITPEDRNKINTTEGVARLMNASYYLEKYPELTQGMTKESLSRPGGNPFRDSDAEKVQLEIAKKLDLSYMPSNHQFLDFMFALSLPVSFSLGLAGEAPAVLSQLKGLGFYTGLRAGVDQIVYQTTGKESLSEALPEGTPEPVRVAVDALEFIGLGFLSHGISERTPGFRDLTDAFTKQTIKQYNLPERLYLDSNQVKDIYQTQGLTTAQQRDAFSKLGLTPAQIKEAFKGGVTIEIPSENVTRVVDQPWWSKVKSLFRMSPTDEVVSRESGKPTVGVRGFLSEGTTPEVSTVTPPETIVENGTVKPGITLLHGIQNGATVNDIASTGLEMKDMPSIPGVAPIGKTLMFTDSSASDNIQGLPKESVIQLNSSDFKLKAFPTAAVEDQFLAEQGTKTLAEAVNKAGYDGFFREYQPEIGEGGNNYFVTNKEKIESLIKGEDITQNITQLPKEVASIAKKVEGGYEFNYNHNTEKAPKPTPDDRFGQKIEPAGKYMILESERGAEISRKKNIPNWEQGKVVFKNPLIIDTTGKTSKEWKVDLSKENGNKKGVNLTNALIEKGYDAIITVENGHTSEVVYFDRLLPENASLRFNPQVVAENQQALKDTYSALPKDQIEEKLFDIYQELDSAEAGRRNLIKDPTTGEITGVLGQKSSFPKWIPSELRDKKAINNVLAYIQDGVENFKFPEGGKSRQRALLNEIFNELDNRLGVDTSAARTAIIEEYGKKSKKGNGQESTSSQSTSETKTDKSKVAGTAETGNSTKIETSKDKKSVPGSGERSKVSSSKDTKSSGKRIETSTVAPQNPLTPIGTGETKTSKLALGVEAKAVEKKLIDALSDLPEYSQVNIDDQKRLAQDYLENNYQDAVEVALGRKAPPAELLPESVFVAVENRAIANGDVELIKQLGASTRSTEATAMGQRIRFLAERLADSPVKAIKDIMDARVERIEKRTGKNINEAVNDTVKQIKQSIPKANKSDWLEFIKELECK